VKRADSKNSSSLAWPVALCVFKWKVRVPPRGVHQRHGNSEQLFKCSGGEWCTFIFVRTYLRLHLHNLHRARAVCAVESYYLDHPMPFAGLQLGLAPRQTWTWFNSQFFALLSTLSNMYTRMCLYCCTLNYKISLETITRTITLIVNFVTKVFNIWINKQNESEKKIISCQFLGSFFSRKKMGNKNRLCLEFIENKI
jgi:hypothetical protein